MRTTEFSGTDASLLLGEVMTVQELTVLEFAKAVRLSKSLVYAMCKEGKIRHRRYGLGRGTIRIDAAFLEQFRQDAEVKTPAPVGLKHINLN